MTKDTNLYAEFERICPHIRGKRNLSAKDVATAIVNAILNDALDAAGAAKKDITGLSWLTEDEQRPIRAKMRDVIQPFITASKNSQNVNLAPVGLMPKVTSVVDETELV